MKAKIRNVRFLDVCNMMADAGVQSLFGFAKGSVFSVCVPSRSNCCSAFSGFANVPSLATLGKERTCRFFN